MLVDAERAADFFTVGVTYFNTEIRPRLPEYDVARPGAGRRMPRYKIVDLEALVESLPVKRPQPTE